MLPEYDFSKGVRGKYARRYFERPSFWHVIATLVAMLFLNNFITSLAMPLLFPAPYWDSLVLDLSMVIVWFYLFRDVIRQIELFRPSRRK